MRPSPAVVETRTFDEALKERVEGLASWMRDNAPACVDEQAHLDEGTQARAYWHYGYLTALRDVRDFLARRRTSLH